MNYEGECPNNRFNEYMLGWKERADKILIYEYYHKGYWRSLPWPIYGNIATDLKYWHSINLYGLYTQYSTTTETAILLMVHKKTEYSTFTRKEEAEKQTRDPVQRQQLFPDTDCR